MYNVNACEHFSYSSILIDIIYNLSTNLLTSAIWQPVAIILTRVTMTISQVVVVGTPPERKQKLSFSSCSLIACALVFFSYLFFFFFFVHSYNRTKREMFRIDFFWQQTHKYFFTEIEPKLRFICSLIVTSFVSNILTRIYLKKNCSACDDYVRLITVTVEAAQA